MTAYYNEHDGEKAAWIRELIRRNMVALGDVDERSITDVRADDLRGYTQCHFFAGIAVWSYALRLAGWPDDRAVWTGSCPCPSFSCAGKGEGFDDPRHLWPVWFPLIRERRPGVLFGEQSHDAIRFGWLDLVQSDMEAEEYAFAPAVLGAHSVGAGHKRQRLYFCADSECDWGLDGRRTGKERDSTNGRNTKAKRPALLAEAERLRSSGHGTHSDGRLPGDRDLQRGGEQRLLAEDCGTGVRPDSEHNGRHRSSGDAAIADRHESQERIPDRDRATELSVDAAQRGLAMHRSASRESGHAAFADETGDGSYAERERLEGLAGDVREWRGPGWLDPLTARSVAAAGATRGFWGDCDWWHARDGKYRPIERGLFPLAHGTSDRVLKLRGYGDAIVPQVAKAFIESYLETRKEL